MSSSNNFENGQAARPRVPIVPGFDPVLSRTFIGPLEDPLLEDFQSEDRNRRRWTAACVIALVSGVIFTRAFTHSAHDKEVTPPLACKVVAVSEIARSSVNVQLDRPPGNERVWVGDDESVIEAHPVPGSAPASAAEYHVDMGNYLHNEAIGVIVGYAMCDNLFNLGSVRPGDEELFAGNGLATVCARLQGAVC